MIKTEFYEYCITVVLASRECNFSCAIICSFNYLGGCARFEMGQIFSSNRNTALTSMIRITIKIPNFSFEIYCYSFLRVHFTIL